VSGYGLRVSNIIVLKSSSSSSSSSKNYRIAHHELRIFEDEDEYEDEDDIERIMTPEPGDQ
jgi:hypothetical protein